MKYEDMFTDWEKLRYEAAWKGFYFKDYGEMYAYIYRRLGEAQANYFTTLLKKEKKVFCARLVYLHHPDKEKAKKGQLYYEKHKGDFLYEFNGSNR